MLLYIFNFMLSTPTDLLVLITTFTEISTFKIRPNRQIKNLARFSCSMVILASFPGLLHLQFLIAHSMLQMIKNWRCSRPRNEARYLA